MTTQLADRFHFLARVGRQDKTPVRAEAPAVGTRESGVAVLRLYDPIDSWGEWFGVSAREFVGVLDELGPDVHTIRVHINSPGGEVWDGLTIYNGLRQHPARVIVVVDGIAASAASVVALAGDEVVMSPGSELMIHDAWGLCVGNAADMERVAADLSRESQNLAGLYALRAGGTADEWRDVMRAETWFTADEAVAAGLADRVDDGDEQQAVTARARFDLSVFAHAGRAAAPAPRSPAPAPAGPGSTPQQEGSCAVAFTDEQLTTMRQELGIPEAADEATIVAALTEALAERAEPSAPSSPAASLPEGTSLIETATLDALRADARSGAQAREQQLADRRDGLVRGAVDDGRIAPARADAWRAALAADPGAEESLAALQPGLVPLAPKGHDGDRDGDAGSDPVAAVRESDVYRNWRV